MTSSRPSSRFESKAAGTTDRQTVIASLTEEGRSVSNQDEVQGRVKEAAGDLTGDKELQREGKIDQASGKAKDAVDKAGDKAKEAVKDD
jgi:uncharacterized protein YjbJ (UPF0337 family)